MADQKLDPKAQYGCLAFDVFLMQRWDYAADTIDDKKQWESFVQQYLALKPVERFSYHEESVQRSDKNYKAPTELAARLFAPHQTVQERNFSARRTSDRDPAWLRTFYAAEWDNAHQGMVHHVAGPSRLVDKGGAWDDASLYDFGSDWSRVLLRVPELCDTVRYSEKSLYPVVPGSQEEETERRQDYGDVDEMELLSYRVATRLYLVDEQALQEDHVKVLWLDCHGNCVWHNKIKAVGLLDFSGAWLATASLCDIVESWGESEENGAELCF